MCVSYASIHLSTFAILALYHCHFSAVARLKRCCNSPVGCELKFRQWITNSATALLPCHWGICWDLQGHPPPSGLDICSFPCSLQYPTMVPAHCAVAAWFLYKNPVWDHTKSPLESWYNCQWNHMVKKHLCRKV